MGKNERKCWKILVIIEFIFVLLISGYTYYITRNDESLKKDKIALENQLVEINQKIGDKIDSNEDIEMKIAYLNDIDNQTIELKNELFKDVAKLEKEIKNGKSKAKIAYLTFDDGPYYSTYDFLKILKKYDIKATFFTIGAGKTNCYDNTSKDCTKLYKEIVKDGHTIANHTYSHSIFNGLYSSTSSFITQIDKQEKLIKDKTGVKTNITRFPGGSSTAGNLKSSIVKELKKKGYGYVDWTAQDGDGGTLNSTDTAWKNFTGSINENIEVVLFHDYSRITLSILPKAIEYLQNKGYIILPLFYDSVMVKKG